MLKLLRERGYDASPCPSPTWTRCVRMWKVYTSRACWPRSLQGVSFSVSKYFVPLSFPEAKSIIVVSVPQPTCEISFNVKGRKVRTIESRRPTPRAVDVDMEIVDLLEKGDGNGVQLMRAILPHKTLAARTGLVEYGRNNITYVPKYGSFHRLTSFFTNRELPDDWQERRSWTAAADCGACVRACPTKAIDDDRFLLHAERCLTFHNEMPNEKAFPDYVLEGVHNAVVGCMICQKVCPVNAQVRNWMVHCTEFDEDDTSYLLKGDFSGPRAKKLSERLEPLGLELHSFPGNLLALLNIGK